MVALVKSMAVKKKRKEERERERERERECRNSDETGDL